MFQTLSKEHTRPDLFDFQGARYIHLAIKRALLIHYQYYYCNDIVSSTVAALLLRRKSN
ncbi:hypothetical protein MPC4_280036 [Methylocella tundrae]|uniref:Uncharacterized protein n=1 Tax=Methylocella tundrae TaxID=227605 RepID=A0A8B6M791_METTU|nr:hypothetical protein MPC1_3350002 [Methylocella tundrae]VTZ50740.1 hypothetical protein MPC4_280036 [Methylocella tundrae]